MDLATVPFVKEWIASWKLIAQHKLYALASMLIDLAFFALFGFLSGPIFEKLSVHVIIIGTLLSEQMRAAEGRARPAIVDALFQQPVSHYTWQFIGLLALLVVAVYVAYCVFHGLTWWLATEVAGKKSHWRAFLTSFFCINALWMGLYVAWYALDTVFDLRRMVVEKLTAAPAQGPAIILSILLVAIGYFALVSYPLLSIRKTFPVGLKRIPAIVPALILIIAQFLVGNLVVGWLFTVNPTVFFVLGAVLLLFLFAWSRLYLARVVRSVSHGV